MRLNNFHLPRWFGQLPLVELSIHYPRERGVEAEDRAWERDPNILPKTLEVLRFSADTFSAPSSASSAVRSTLGVCGGLGTGHRTGAGSAWPPANAAPGACTKPAAHAHTQNKPSTAPGWR